MLTTTSTRRWTRSLKFLPPAYKGVIDYIDVHGRTKIVVRGQISEYIPNPTFEVVARPGAQEEYYRVGNPTGKSRREMFGEPIKSPPAYREPAARIELMDEQGIDRTLMFPTLASLLEERLRDDPDAIHVIVHASQPVDLRDLELQLRGPHLRHAGHQPLRSWSRAIEELEWVLERGAKTILIRPAPVPGLRGPRSFGLPEFDPFWERVVEPGILVTMHSSDSGYARYVTEWTGSDTEMLPFLPQTFRMLQSWRPIEDAVASMVCHGAFTRHPELRVAIVENGMSWVAPLLRNIKDLWKKMPQDFPENPIEAFKRCIYISPFWEDDLAASCGAHR